MYGGQQHEGHAGVLNEIPHLETEQRISSKDSRHFSEDKIYIFQTKEWLGIVLGLQCRQTLHKSTTITETKVLFSIMKNNKRDIYWASGILPS